MTVLLELCLRKAKRSKKEADKDESPILHSIGKSNQDLHFVVVGLECGYVVAVNIWLLSRITDIKGINR